MGVPSPVLTSLGYTDYQISSAHGISTTARFDTEEEALEWFAKETKFLTTHCDFVLWANGNRIVAYTKIEMSPRHTIQRIEEH